MLTILTRRSNSAIAQTTICGRRFANRKRRQSANRSEYRHDGFTLIEVLMAMIVLSLGLLGLVALQTRSLAASHSAYLTSVASIQAMSLADMMRANPEGADVYRTTNLDELGPSASRTECEDSYCTPAELASYDLARWAEDTRNKFPSNLRINLKTTVDPSYNDYRLELSWQTPTPNRHDGLPEFIYTFWIGHG